MRFTSENALIQKALDNPEMRGFVLFSLDLGATRNPKELGPGGLTFPDFQGEETPMWTISATGDDTETVNKKNDAKLAAKQHALRVEVMAANVARGLTPQGEQIPELNNGYILHEEETPQIKDKGGWTKFWGGATPTERYAMTID